MMTIFVGLTVIAFAMIVSVSSEGGGIGMTYKLTTADGEVIEGEDFAEMLAEHMTQFEQLPEDEIGELVLKTEAKRKSLEEDLKANNADRQTATMAISNLYYDFYEEAFALAGLKLEIFNREPMFLTK